MSTAERPRMLGCVACGATWGGIGTLRSVREHAARAGWAVLLHETTLSVIDLCPEHAVGADACRNPGPLP